MNNSKWFTGLEASEILSEMEKLASDTYATYFVAKTREEAEENGDPKEKDLYTKISQVIPAIVDVKTAYYMYNKEVWNLWDTVQSELFQLQNKLEIKILGLYKMRGWL